MNEPPALRIPYDIWENILLELIESVSLPFFGVRCTTSTYLNFRRTSLDGKPGGISKATEYLEGERQKVKLALVCRAWKVFADAFAVRKRLICWEPLRDLAVISDEVWRGAERIEIRSVPTEELYDPDANEQLLVRWKGLGMGGNGMRVTRLDIIHSRRDTFAAVLDALCDASSAIPHLRSLGFFLPTRKGTPFGKISTHFSHLAHLTLVYYHRPTGGVRVENLTEIDAEDALDLHKLEVLFLFPLSSMLIPSNWNLPALQCLYIFSGTNTWNDGFLLFLTHHSSITVLDLHKFNLTETLDISTITQFWDMFPRLELLRCRLSTANFPKYPHEHHSLRILVSLDVITSETGLLHALQPWLDPGVKKLESIILDGPESSYNEYKQLPAVRELFLRVQERGTQLLGPDGKPWLDV